MTGRSGGPRSGATTVQTLTVASAIVVAIAVGAAMAIGPGLQAQAANANRPLAAWQVMLLNVANFGLGWWWLILIAGVVAVGAAGVAGKPDRAEHKNSE